MARATTRGTRIPQRADDRARRHGLRAVRLLRQSDGDPQPRRAGRRRAALQQHAHHGAVLAVAFLHHHRPQPPRQRHGGGHRDGHRIPRLQRQHPVRERVPVRDAAAARIQHVHARQVAPDALGAGVPAGPYTRWPLSRGFERFYGFLGGDTNQWYPDLVYDNHQVEPPAHRSRATTSPRTWRTRRCSSSPTPSRSPPTSRSSSTSAPVPPTHRTTCHASGQTATGAGSTTAGTPIAR